MAKQCFKCFREVEFEGHAPDCSEKQDLSHLFKPRVDTLSAAQVPDANGWQDVYTIDEMEEFFVSKLPAMREAAKVCGYALARHGSQRRDFDLIAIPWAEVYSAPNALAEALQKAACGIHKTEYTWEQKLHGRIATAFSVCWLNFKQRPGEGHVDLSVMGTPKIVHVMDQADFLKFKHDGAAPQVSGDVEGMISAFRRLTKIEGTKVINDMLDTFANTIAAERAALDKCGEYNTKYQCEAETERAFRYKAEDLLTAERATSDRLREALEFYANGNVKCFLGSPIEGLQTTKPHMDMGIPCGTKAKQALADKPEVGK